MILVSGNIKLMQIFAMVPLGGDVKRHCGFSTTAIFGDLGGYVFENFRDTASNIIRCPLSAGKARRTSKIKYKKTCMQFILFYCSIACKSSSLFYCSHPYNCNIFMQDLQVGGISAVYHTLSGLLVHRDRILDSMRAKTESNTWKSISYFISSVIPQNPL